MHINLHLYTFDLKFDLRCLLRSQNKACLSSVCSLFLHHHHFLLIADLLSCGFAVLKIDTVLGSNYPSRPNYLFNVFFSKMPAVYGTAPNCLFSQGACSAHLFSTSMSPSMKSHSPYRMFRLHLHMSAKPCPSFALGILIKVSSLLTVLRELTSKCKEEIMRKNILRYNLIIFFLIKPRHAF